MFKRSNNLSFPDSTGHPFSIGFFSGTAQLNRFIHLTLEKQSTKVASKKQNKKNPVKDSNVLDISIEFMVFHVYFDLLAVPF